MSDTPSETVLMSWINDSSISFAARGLLLELAHAGRGYQANVAELVRRGPEGESEVRELLEELTKAGYIRDGRIIAEW